MDLQSYNTTTSVLGVDAACSFSSVRDNRLAWMSGMNHGDEFRYWDEAAAIPVASSEFSSYIPARFTSTTEYLTYATQVELESAAFKIFEEEKARGIDFVSVAFIAGKCDRDAVILSGILERSPKFRRTYMKSRSGQDVYMLESSFAFLKNVWKSFLHLNALKS